MKFFTTLVLSLFILHASGQQYVVIDATNRNVSNVLPFDLYFTLTIKKLGLDASVKHVDVVVYEMNRASKLARMAIPPVDLDSILKHTAACTAKNLVVDHDSVTMVFTSTLKPNKDYVVEVSKRGLKADEQALVVARLNDPKNQLGVTVAEKLATAPDFLKTASLTAYIDTMVAIHLRKMRTLVTQNGFELNVSNNVLLPEKEMQDFETAVQAIEVALKNVLVLNVPADRRADATFTDAGNTKLLKGFELLEKAKPTNLGDIDNLLNSDNATFLPSGNAAVAASKQPLLDAWNAYLFVLRSLHDRIADKISFALSVKLLGKSYELSTSEGAKFHFSLNTGILYDTYGDKIRPFTTTSFYLRSIRNDLPLDAYNHSIKTFILSRTAITVGLSTNSIADPGSDKKGVIDDHAALIGLGFRIWSFATVNWGGMIFQQDDRNPLIKDYHTKITPYIGVSINIETKNLFGNN